MARPGRKRKVELRSEKAWIEPRKAAPQWAAGEPVKRRVDLFSLCCWVYSDQMAHRLLPSSWAWFLYDLDAAGELGPDAARPVVHKDAAAVHRIVEAMDQQEAAAIIRHALAGERPEPPVAQPQPQPMWAEHANMGPDDSTGWAVFGDRRRTFVVSRAGNVAVAEPVVERRGKKFVVVGQRADSVPVEYCPVTWWPDLEWVRMENHAYWLWQRAMGGLLERLAAVSLRDHVVTGLDDSGPAPAFTSPKVRDARYVEDGYHPRVRVTVGLGRKLTTPNGTDLCYRHARGTITAKLG